MAGNDKKKVGKEKTAKKAKTAKSDWNDEKAKTAAVNVLDAAAMENAHNICHNVQVDTKFVFGHLTFF